MLNSLILLGVIIILAFLLGGVAFLMTLFIKYMLQILSKKEQTDLVGLFFTIYAMLFVCWFIMYLLNIA